MQLERLLDRIEDPPHCRGGLFSGQGLHGAVGVQVEIQLWSQSVQYVGNHQPRRLARERIDERLKDAAQHRRVMQ